MQPQLFEGPSAPADVESIPSSKSILRTLFSDQKLGAVAKNFIHQMARRHNAENPVELIRQVSANAESWKDGMKIVTTLQANPALATALCRQVIEEEALPAADRKRLKEEKGRQKAPPTAAQIRYLRRLGYAGPAPESMAQASETIDRLKK